MVGNWGDYKLWVFPSQFIYRIKLSLNFISLLSQHDSAFTGGSERKIPKIISEIKKNTNKNNHRFIDSVQGTRSEPKYSRASVKFTPSEFILMGDIRANVRGWMWWWVICFFIKKVEKILGDTFEYGDFEARVRFTNRSPVFLLQRHLRLPPRTHHPLSIINISFTLIYGNSNTLKRFNLSFPLISSYFAYRNSNSYSSLIFPSPNQ